MWLNKEFCQKIYIICKNINVKMSLLSNAKWDRDKKQTNDFFSRIPYWKSKAMLLKTKRFLLSYIE